MRFPKCLFLKEERQVRVIKIFTQHNNAWFAYKTMKLWVSLQMSLSHILKVSNQIIKPDCIFFLCAMWWIFKQDRFVHVHIQIGLPFLFCFSVLWKCSRVHLVHSQPFCKGKIVNLFPKIAVVSEIPSQVHYSRRQDKYRVLPCPLGLLKSCPCVRDFAYTGSWDTVIAYPRRRLLGYTPSEERNRRNEKSSFFISQPTTNLFLLCPLSSWSF